MNGGHEVSVSTYDTSLGTRFRGGCACGWVGVAAYRHGEPAVQDAAEHVQRVLHYWLTFVMEYPEDVAVELRKLGWTVTPPEQSPQDGTGT